MIRFAVLALLATSLPLQAQTLKFCGDGAGWPPYTYEEKVFIVQYIHK